MNGKSNFEPLVVLQFASNTPEEIKNWVIKRLTAKPDDDEGADLLVRYDTSIDNNKEFLLIGATLNRLLIGAEELRIKKPCKKHGLREFLVSDIKSFHNSENPDTFLLKSEKQSIIWEEIQTIRPMQHEHFVPGFPEKSISPKNDTILGLLNNLNFIARVFPLHDREDIKLVEHDWFKSVYSFFKPQDIRKIRNYFGENVAYYFAFLEFYTKALVPTALIGILVSVWPGADFFKYSLFCLFNVIWCSIFIERWKRLSNRLAYEWGSYDLQIFERPRSLYYGDLRFSDITNQEERRYPRRRRLLKTYFVSCPAIVLCSAFSLWIYFIYYRIQMKVNAKYPLNDSLFSFHAEFMRTLPSAVYSLFIMLLNSIFKGVATLLTDFENHRLQTSYENNLTWKLFAFYSVNCFIGLFYEAFINVNYDNVVQLLTGLVIVNPIFLKFTEQLAPYVAQYLKKEKRQRGTLDNNQSSDAIKQARVLIHFQGTYEDYLTIFEQFGYISLFSAVFPWITICALVNNFLELRADAFKYCHVYQRPFAQRAWNIGSWGSAFDILSSVSIVTNTALIAMQPSVREHFSTYTNAEYFLLFVVAEHILLVLKFAISAAIPSTPHEVEIAKNRSLYESMQALRHEREHRAKKAQMSMQQQ